MIRCWCVPDGMIYIMDHDPCRYPDCPAGADRPHPSDPPNNVTDEIRATTAPPPAGFAPIDRELAEQRYKEGLDAIH